MHRKLRFVAFLLIFAILSCRLCIVNVNAAQGVESDNTATKLSGLRITDLSKPVAGKTLDFTARVRTNENVSWEIPVIWIDDQGNTATVAEPGKTYTPHFVFYIPNGYTIDSSKSSGRFEVKLPDFLTALFGNTPLIFVTDAEKGITYISFETSVNPQKAAAAETTSDISNVPALYPGSDTAQDTVQSGEPDSRPAGGSSNVSPGPAAPEDDPAEGQEEELPEQVRIHCSQSAIENISPEALEEIVTLIKNKLEPQAVNLLKNSFSAYSGAPESALGKEIGLYVYYDSGSIADDHGNTVPTPENSLAFVQAGYLRDLSGEDIYSYVMGLDTNNFMRQDPDTGAWRFIEEEKDALSNTVVHEMMHAFMDDYTRRGMADTTDRFPVWFIEGFASAVENVYQYRAYQFQVLGNVQNNAFDSNLKRYPGSVSYSNSSIRNKYTDPNLEGGYRYDLGYSGTPGNTGSAYVSGYMAVVYLGYLAALRSGETNIITSPASENGPTTVNIDAIRYGTSRILELLHEGYSLDSVIRFVSATQEGDADPYYDGTDDFTARFIKGTDEDSVSRNIYGSNETVMGSLSFCSYYLNYLNSQSDEEGDYRHLANGSILSSDQSYVSPLNWNTTTDADLYGITDSQNFTASTVSDEIAWDSTGGKHKDHLPDEQDCAEDQSRPEEGLAAAANVPNIVIEVVSDDAPEPDRTEENHTPTEATDPESPAETVDPAEAVQPVTEIEQPLDDTAGVAPDTDLPVPGVEPVLLVSDSELGSEGDDYSFLPQDEDALLPDNSALEAEPAAGSDDHDDTPSGDAPSDDSSSGDSPSDDPPSDDNGSASDSEPAPED